MLSERLIQKWLTVLCIMTIGMVVLGGITRLTESGLSIVEWKPIMGAIPPLGGSQWSETFKKYQATPEYRAVNYGMSLEQFKQIFLWEYLHRLLGRLIGLVLFVPLIVLSIRKKVPRFWIPRLWFLFFLGGMQGALGWFMVKSGLVFIPQVSHLRLASHLALAFTIIGVEFWFILDSRYRENKSVLRHPLPKKFHFLLGFLFLCFCFQVAYGAFTAKLKAGVIYNTFPMMGESFVPEELFLTRPIVFDIIQNIVSIQWIHRGLAWIILLGTLLLAITSKNRVAQVLFISVFFQFCLGVLTLIWIVPKPLAGLHQLGAVIVLLAFVRLSYSAGLKLRTG